MNDDDAKARCDTCRYWVRLSGEQLGECRRHPPAAFSSSFFGFVRTGANQWCGEFDPGERPNEEKVKQRPQRNQRVSA